MILKKSFRFFLQSPSAFKLFSIESNVKDALRLGKNLRKHEKNIKDKYLNSQFSQLPPDELKKAIDKDYEDLKETLTSQNGILSKLKQNLFSEEESTNQASEQKSSKSVSEEQAKLRRQAKEYFDSLSNTDLLQKSKIIKKNLATFDEPSPFQPLTSSTQFGNYSSFEKSYAQIRDKKLDFDMLGQDAYSGHNIQEFIKSLDSSYREKRKLDSATQKLRLQNPGWSREELERSSIERFNELARIREKNHFLNDEEQSLVQERIDESDSDAEDDGEFEMESNKMLRLSPKARDDIFQLYLSGWSLRDISNRYGILPNRAKAVIYLRSIYYYQVLPRVDYTHIKMMEEMEAGSREVGAFEYCDYGIDLEEMISREKGVVTPAFAQFRDADVAQADVMKDPAVLEKLAQKMKRKKEYTTVGVIGKGNQSYFLKEVQINHGKGMEGVPQMFQKVLNNSHEAWRLPNRVVSRLSRGPRSASSGFNNK